MSFLDKVKHFAGGHGVVATIADAADVKGSPIDAQARRQVRGREQADPTFRFRAAQRDT